MTYFFSPHMWRQPIQLDTTQFDRQFFLILHSRGDLCACGSYERLIRLSVCRHAMCRECARTGNSDEWLTNCNQCETKNQMMEIDLDLLQWYASSPFDYPTIRSIERPYIWAYMSFSNMNELRRRIKLMSLEGSLDYD